MAFFVEQCMKNMHIAGPQHHFRHTNRLTRLPFSSMTCIKIPDTLFHLGPWELKGWWGMMGDSAAKVLAFSPIGENFRRRVGGPGCRDVREVTWRIIQQRAVRSERSWGAHVPIVGELLHDRLVAISGHVPSTSSTYYLILFIWFYLCWLVVWNMFLFFHMGRIITDELIFFRGIETTNHYVISIRFYPWSAWETFSSRKQDRGRPGIFRTCRFHEWPDAALQSVANHFLGKTGMPDEVLKGTGCISAISAHTKKHPVHMVSAGGWCSQYTLYCVYIYNNNNNNNYYCYCYCYYHYCYYYYYYHYYCYIYIYRFIPTHTHRHTYTHTYIHGTIFVLSLWAMRSEIFQALIQN